MTGSLKSNLTGRIFGQLTVMSMHQQITSRGKRLSWMCGCRCSCGAFTVVLASNRKRGSAKSCGCARDYSSTSGSNSGTFSGWADIRGKTWGQIKRRAQLKGLPFTIDIKDAWELYLAQNRACALSGLDIEFHGTRKSKTTASLDRIEISKGYEPGNVQWVHKHINIMRNVYTVAYFVELCGRVASYASN
jgi:hypothetical protein